MTDNEKLAYHEGFKEAMQLKNDRMWAVEQAIKASTPYGVVDKYAEELLKFIYQISSEVGA